MRFRKTPTTGSAIWWVGLGCGAALAGFLLGGTGLPAAWLVGPMLVAIVFAVTGREQAAVPRVIQSAAQAVVGTILAATFRPSVIPLIASHWLPVGISVSGTLLTSLAAGFVLARVVRLDRGTATMGTLPGAASGMIVMSEPVGADPRLVALMQYARVVLVVVSATLISRFGLGHAPGGHSSSSTSSSLPTAPPDHHWLAYLLTALVAVVGMWAGRYLLRLPAGALIGPLILGVALREAGVLQAVWPPGVPQLAYAVIGVYVGLLFDPDSLRRAGRLLPAILVSMLLVMAVCAGLGWVFGGLTGADQLTAYLATTPGGIDSVAITALGSGADASLVLAVQMLRLFAVVLAAPLLARRLRTKA